MLAATFIYGGINALRAPEGHAKVAEPVLDKTVGKQADMLPDAVPTDALTLVKIDAGVKIAAGTALALGKFPRLASLALLGSLVPTTVAGHPFWASETPAERDQELIHFLKNAGLAGGLLIAAADTHGKPSLGWRARRAARRAGVFVDGAGDSVQDTVRGARTKTTYLAGRASKAVESALPN
ncbi:hypothetical protein CFN78_14480 [Amycolatopsis antarctica]|uniref:DoxX family protein n=1 Tax=Amycolatopsis antarctica TaxID=1854586 RepID=A0A263D323_9PSEU|nr:hypothetical protein CFN78_14480 [Amycolatopsis antarctica]